MITSVTICPTRTYDMARQDISRSIGRVQQTILLTVVIDSPGIRRNIVAIGVGDISCSSYCRILRRNRVND